MYLHKIYSLDALQFDLRHFKEFTMSVYKKELTEREEDRRLFFLQQKEIREAYEAEEKERKQREANAYTYALTECGLI